MTIIFSLFCKSYIGRRLKISRADPKTTDITFEINVTKNYKKLLLYTIATLPSTLSRYWAWSFAILFFTKIVLSKPFTTPDALYKKEKPNMYISATRRSTSKLYMDHRRRLEYKYEIAKNQVIIQFRPLDPFAPLTSCVIDWK